MGSEIFIATGASSELNDQALAHEVGAMESRNDIARIHGVLVLDEAEAIHELDLGNLTGSVGLEVGFDVCLGGIAREVAQVQAGGRDFRHGCDLHFAFDG